MPMVCDVCVQDSPVVGVCAGEGTGMGVPVVCWRTWDTGSVSELTRGGALRSAL